jgi:hypothetical protein
MPTATPTCTEGHDGERLHDCALVPDTNLTRSTWPTLPTHGAMAGTYLRAKREGVALRTCRWKAGCDRGDRSGLEVVGRQPEHHRPPRLRGGRGPDPGSHQDASPQPRQDGRPEPLRWRQVDDRQLGARGVVRGPRLRGDPVRPVAVRQPRRRSRDPRLRDPQRAPGAVRQRRHARATCGRTARPDRLEPGRPAVAAHLSRTNRYEYFEHRYLEKIVQLPIFRPRLSDEELRPLSPFWWRSGRRRMKAPSMRLPIVLRLVADDPVPTVCGPMKSDGTEGAQLKPAWCAGGRRLERTSSWPAGPAPGPTRSLLRRCRRTASGRGLQAA